VTGLFFGLAILSVVGRGVIRVLSQRRPTLDDYFVLFGALCLIAATGVYYADIEYLYLTQALYIDPTIILKTPAPKLIKTATVHMGFLDAYLNLLWTATFAVKFSFLAFFRQLVQSVDRVRTYYWFVVGVTVVSWMFVVSETFILCHHFGVNTCKLKIYFGGYADLVSEMQIRPQDVLRLDWTGDCA
jgi:hypothetical protein